MPVYGREWNQFACAENTFMLVLWNTPILRNFQRVGRSVVQMMSGVPFPHDLLKSAKCESLPEMTRFIDVLLIRVHATKHFYSKI